MVLALPSANCTTAQGPVRLLDGPQQSQLYESTALMERYLSKRWNLAMFLEERYNMLLEIESSDVEPMEKIPYHTPQFQQLYVFWKKATTHYKHDVPVSAQKSKAKKAKRQKVSVHRKRGGHRTPSYPTTWLKRIDWRQNKIMVHKFHPMFRRTSLPKVPSLAEAENDIHGRTLSPRHVGFSKSVHVRLIPPLHHNRRARISKEHQDRVFINDPASLQDQNPVQEHITERCEQREQSILSRTIRCIIECLCCSGCCTTGGEN
ncbi:uncharacterized protein LOC130275572 [Hyla sarda]|uniref:uncharacterized protein LOC130275572 n=1 Tax=Hyla sarda TaxID=327740 RepID=UPI0024C23E51|nr:uncharacterized protein LOC130275572 [Hyla sarda]XP_056379670.1 uncharacterized protein LOC130275572 [Hyla sarda]XP_056379671.1 uncharacterized protein LOC130275572 [Hyla sarda]XP_056379672.1 uncharacterized protein LOC130275572 [Hyla sarda]XP_056379673.1 uncharacterized protein LOC130275572 [Hyla sarda]